MLSCYKLTSLSKKPFDITFYLQYEILRYTKLVNLFNIPCCKLHLLVIVNINIEYWSF